MTIKVYKLAAKFIHLFFRTIIRIIIANMQKLYKYNNF